ncbi:MAG: helix-turn-helix domain-containing protein [Mycobacteriales bacterium]
MTTEHSTQSPSRGGQHKPVLLTIDEAADRMGVGVRFMRRLIEEGRIPVLKLGERKTRLDEADIDAYIERARIEPDGWGPHRQPRRQLPHPGPTAA